MEVGAPWPVHYGWRGSVAKTMLQSIGPLLHIFLVLHFSPHQTAATPPTNLGVLYITGILHFSIAKCHSCSGELAMRITETFIHYSIVKGKHGA